MALGKYYATTSARKKKSGTAMQKANKALRLAKKGVNHGWIDKDASAQTMTGSLTPNVIFIDQPSLDDTNFDYRQKITKIEYDIFIYQNLTSTLNDSYRVDLVLDKQPAGVTLSLLNLYNDATPVINAMKDGQYRHRYEILKSFSGVFNENVSTSRHIKGTCMVNRESVANAETVGNAGAVMKNAYYLVFWSDTTANHPTYSYYLRCHSIQP